MGTSLTRTKSTKINITGPRKNIFFYPKFFHRYDMRVSYAAAYEAMPFSPAFFAQDMDHIHDSHLTEAELRLTGTTARVTTLSARVPAQEKGVDL